MRYFQAVDTFIAELEGGVTQLVSKGDPLPESHELVKRDQAGAGSLFKPLGDDEPPSKPARARAVKGA